MPNERASDELNVVCLNYQSLARIELFNGKGGLVEGLIERVDRTGLDFVAIKDTIVVHPHEPQWDVFAAFGKFPRSSMGATCNSSCHDMLCHMFL